MDLDSSNAYFRLQNIESFNVIIFLCLDGGFLGSMTVEKKVLLLNRNKKKKGTK